MSIINSRPLTTDQLNQYSSIEPLPLTPNMLLTMKAQSHAPLPGEFDEPYLYSRKRWRRVQYLSQQFWARWKLEYLQKLQQRQKWNLKNGDVMILTDPDLPAAL